MLNCQINFYLKKSEGAAAAFSTENAHSLVGLAPVPHIINSLFCSTALICLLFSEGSYKNEILLSI